VILVDFPMKVLFLFRSKSDFFRSVVHPLIQAGAALAFVSFGTLPTLPTLIAHFVPPGTLLTQELFHVLYIVIIAPISTQYNRCIIIPKSNILDIQQNLKGQLFNNKFYWHLLINISVNTMKIEYYLLR